jgi:hypothetical protein
MAEQRVTPAMVAQHETAINSSTRADPYFVLPMAAPLDRRFVVLNGPADLRLFINGVEVDLTTTFLPDFPAFSGHLAHGRIAS